MEKLRYLHTIKKFPNGNSLVILDNGVTALVNEKTRYRLLLEYYEDNKKKHL